MKAPGNDSEHSQTIVFYTNFDEKYSLWDKAKRQKKCQKNVNGRPVTKQREKHFLSVN